MAFWQGSSPPLSGGIVCPIASPARLRTRPPGAVRSGPVGSGASLPPVPGGRIPGPLVPGLVPGHLRSLAQGLFAAVPSRLVTPLGPVGRGGPPVSSGCGAAFTCCSPTCLLLLPVRAEGADPGSYPERHRALMPREGAALRGCALPRYRCRAPAAARRPAGHPGAGPVRAFHCACPQRSPPSCFGPCRVRGAVSRRCGEGPVPTFPLPGGASGFRSGARVQLRLSAVDPLFLLRPRPRKKMPCPAAGKRTAPRRKKGGGVLRCGPSVGYLGGGRPAAFDCARPQSPLFPSVVSP